jgi:hypothetical protein
VPSSQPLLPLVVLLAAVAAISQARAAPLDADTCNKLKIEQDELENAGVERNMAKGPEWAKVNLTPEKIEQVRRFIELEELILFRCRGKTLVTLPAEPESDRDKDKHKQAKNAKNAPGAHDKGKRETAIPKTMPQPAAAATKAPAPAARADLKKAQAAKKPAAKQPKKPAAKQPAKAAAQ